MRTIFFALLGFCLLTSPTVPANSINIGQSDTVSSNYVVIGAFFYKKNAVRFTWHANQVVDNIRMVAKCELNANRNLYYVYVLITDDHEKALHEATRLRSETEFSDTWVYRGPFTKSEINKNYSATDADINPITNQKIEEAATNYEPVVVVTEEEPVAENKTSTPDEADKGKKFLFNIFRGMNSEPIEGDVDIIDSDNSKKIGTYKGNVPVKIPSTISPKKLSFICEVFGYRKLQRDLDLTVGLEGDMVLDENNDIVVPLELVRLQRGDIEVMYNVFFFKDAGIMRPESHFEVNNLLVMMKENPKYKITIHGHTNGGAAGKIISPGKSKNLFSLNDTKESIGSAKKLSEVRAQVIKEYLVENGIDPARMNVKAWGGKRPIHDKHSNRAQENVRVEIEILED